MLTALEKFACVSAGLIIVTGVFTCIYLDLREFIYHELFKERFGLDSLPNHIRIRIADKEDALRNEYHIRLLDSSQPVAVFDCVMYVGGWKLTTGWANDISSVVRILEKKGISFSDESKNESSCMR